MSNHNSLSWSKQQGAALSLALAELAQKSDALILIVATDVLITQRLADEISFFKSPDLPIVHFPDWETLPYDSFSPHQEIISERLKTLSQLPTLNKGVLFTTVNTLMQRLPPKDYIQAHAFSLTKTKISLDTLKNRFVEAGYQNVAQVLAPGEFAVRGSLFDIFPMGSEFPYRIDLFGDDIESISTFDPETQRTIEKVDNIHLLPAREFPLDKEAISLFRQQWREMFTGNPMNCPVYETISQGASISGIEYYLPLFFKETQTLFDYLPKACVVVCIDKLGNAITRFDMEIKQRYEQLKHDASRPILAPQKLFLDQTALFTRMNQFARIDAALSDWQAPQLFIDHKAEDPFALVKQFLAQTKSRILFCAESAGRREALLNLLNKGDIYPEQLADWQSFLNSDVACGITVAPLGQGMHLVDANIEIIPEAALLGSQVLQQRRRDAKKNKALDPDSIVRNLTELREGSAVVHLHHGVGRYVGLQTLTIGEHVGEYLTLEYANSDKLYVPVSSLHLISRYSGVDIEGAPLHKLGTEQWEKAKRRAQEQVRDVAAELLEIHAKRAAREGHAYDLAKESYALFANGFAFEETLDQQQAIQEVIADMQSPRSMDRLICGDVGFGKTEVAMRAAFIAVQEGHQVAVLVPTTLLAQQHYQNFCDRFADWPVRIEMLSRFRSQAEQAVALKQLATGQLDIVIGTHKLLQKEIKFKQLGLMIIDEEHRFGVRQKEQLKALRSEVDILTLTATPIPRTLNMAMSGMRDLSIIGTPPAKRLAIKTFVHERSSSLIREAVLREIMRGGQVFFLHNNVETILRTAEELKALIPEAKIAIAHGQMPERELEQVMRDFYHQRSQILVCTTIIETGIDIPSANTIIMDRADKLGLAQLHQLRGRVGRSHHQAYAYLLTMPGQKLTPDAEKRLEAIASLEELGAGFTLATHDLEIRGAGELLGENQSGNIQEIGFTLYMELLEKAVKALKSGQLIDSAKSDAMTEVDLQIPALIPEDYVPDVHMRLILYKRIANAKSNAELDELKVEFIDRFGLLPTSAKYLFEVTDLKLQAQTLGIRKIDANHKGARLEFIENPPIDPMCIIKLIQLEPQRYRLDGQNKLRFFIDQSEPEERLANVQKLLGRVA